MSRSDSPARIGGSWEWTATDAGEVVPIVEDGNIVRTWIETTNTGERRRYAIDQETERMSVDRRSDKPQSLTIRAGDSRVVHGVRIDVVRAEDGVCRMRVWRERVIQDLEPSRVDSDGE